MRTGEEERVSGPVRTASGASKPWSFLPSRGRASAMAEVTGSGSTSRDEVQAAEIDELVEKKFGGSLPAFIAAFAKNRRLSKSELDEVQRMIDSFREGDGDG